MVTAPARSSSALTEQILGPACRFRLQGRRLQLGPKNDLVAEYRDGEWHYQGDVYAILESEAPTLVEFDDADAWRPSLRGPFTALQVQGGAIRFGPGFQKILAEFDEHSESWCVYPEQKNYREVVLSPAKPGYDEELPLVEPEASMTRRPQQVRQGVAGRAG